MNKRAVRWAIVAVTNITTGVAFVLVAMLLASCSGAECNASIFRGGWVDVPQIRRTRNVGIVGEIESRVANNRCLVYINGVPQILTPSSATTTWTHETAHQLNNEVRTRYGGTGAVNAFYVPGGKAWVGVEPRGVTIALIARYASGGERYGIRQLYLVEMARVWNNQPLYLLDEAVAYANGALATLQTGRDRDQLTKDLYAARTMHGWGLVLATLAERTGNDVTELKQFLAWLGAYIEFLERGAR